MTSTFKYSAEPYSPKSTDKAELGATYIHGIESNPIYQIAEQHNLLKLTQRELKSASILAVMEDGEEVNTKIVQEVDWHYGMLMQDCEEFYMHHKPTPVENDSVGNHMKREMNKYLERYDGEDRHVREMLFQQRLLHEACLCGSDEAMTDVSLGEIGECVSVCKGSSDAELLYTVLALCFLHSTCDKSLTG